MKRLLRGSVVLAVAVGFLSCSGDPTSDLREPVGITATPTTVFIDVGETKPVIASLQDEQGNQIAATYEITAVGPGITVVPDPTYQNTTAGVVIQNAVRFQVTGNAIANSSFTISAEGQTLVVPVRVTPATVSIAVSNSTPAFGEAITLTAPAGVLFTDSSVVTFAGGPEAQIVSMSPDRTQLTIIPGPNVIGVVSVSNTTVSYDESLNFDITGSANDTVLTGVLTSLEGAALSNQAPILGETVTLTLPAGVKVLPTAALDTTVVIGETDSIGVLADSGLIVEGATNPRDVVVSPDSSTITFVPAPNSDSVVTVRGVVRQELPQFPQILSTTLKITTPIVDTFPSSVSTTTPAVNVPVVLTSTDPNYTIVDPAVVAIGLDSNAFVTSQTASSITFLPMPGSTGTLGVGAVDVVGFGLPLPSNAPAITTSSTVPSLAGTGTPGTAPALAVPAIGAVTALYDSGTFDYLAFDLFPTRLYRLVVPAGQDITVTLNWNSTEDLGVYWFEADGVTEAALDPADAGGEGAHPESVINTFTAGTYLLAVLNFNTTTPPWIGIKLESSATPPPE